MLIMVNNRVVFTIILVINDENIYNLLCKYGSLDKARNNSKKINEEHKNDEPSLSESCTVVHRLFD